MNLNQVFYKLLFTIFIWTCVLTSEELNSYLLDRLDFVNTKLSNAKRNVLPRETQKSIEFHESKTVALPYKYQGAHAFTLFNKNYLLLDYELFYIVSQDETFVLTSHTKFKKFDNKIVFIKTVDYNLGLMFVAFENGLSHIYAYTANKENFFIQSIKNPNKLTDARFFLNNGSLYLIVSSMLGVSLAPLTVYKWEGTHFDEIDKALLEGAIALENFPSKNSEIIIVLRNNGIEKSNSYVYEFHEDKLHKIQILDTSKPTKITTYNMEHRNFVIIFDDVSNNILYLWEETELVPFVSFNTPLGPKRVFHSYINAVPLLFLSYEKDILVYALKFDAVQQLSTYRLPENYTEILDLTLIEDLSEDSLFILGIQEDKLKFTVIPFKLHETEIVSQIREEDELGNCLDNLNNILLENEGKLKNILKRTEKIVKVDEPVEFKGRVNVAAPVVAQFASINSHFDFQDNLLKIEEEVGAMEEKLKVLRPKIGDLFHTDDTIVNGKLIIQGGINAEKLIGENIYVKKLNGVNWTPEHWLSYSKDQGIAGDFLIREMSVKDLQLPKLNKIFNDLVLLNGNQKLKGGSFNSLGASNIYLQEINKIPMDKVYLRSHPVKISGNKSFNNLFVKNVDVESLNGKNASDVIKLFGDPKAVNYEFSNLRIKNLHIGKMNGVDWNEFSSSVFKIGTEQIIKGNVTITGMKMHNLATGQLSGIETNKLLTTSTNQTVDSKIQFGNVDVQNVVCDQINDLVFETDVATFGTNEKTLINGPVTIKNVEIDNINMTGPIDKSSGFCKQNHIVGTNETELLQIYNNKVKISGNLHLENVYLAETTKLFVDGNEFNQANFNQYWLKNTNQEIPVHFEAHQGITTPHLNTKLLNNIPIDDYMLNNLLDKPPTVYVFENATVFGNIIINKDNKHTPDLDALQHESVKLNGTYVIKGRKKFSGKVGVDHLKADLINSQSTADFPTVHTPEIRGLKIFENLVITGDVTTKTFLTNSINTVDLKGLNERAVFLDRPTSFVNLDFINVTANEAFVSNINNKVFNEYVIKTNQIYVMDTLNKMEVKGNLTLNNVDKVSKLNNVNVMEKFENNRKSDVIKGNVTFDGRVHVKNLFVVNVNGINFTDLLPRLYYRHWPQNVTARHSFKVVTTPYILTPEINEINVGNLVDTKSEEVQFLKINNGLQLNSPKFMKSLRGGYAECDIEKASYAMKNIPTRFWKSIHVKNDAFILDEETELFKLLKYGVTSNKNNSIKAPVKLNHLSAESVFTKKHINGVNLNEIVNDALLISAQDQIVTGYKEFSTVKAAGAEILGNVQIPKINNIDIQKLNQSIIYKNEINNILIKGSKTFFAGLQADNIESKLVAGVLPENLVSLFALRPIPNATFDSLEILNDFNIGFVNNQNFTHFLLDRLLLSSNEEQITTSLLFIQEGQLNGPSIFPAINEILMEDVVFDQGVQTITSPKTFANNLEILGDVIMKQINDFDLQLLYEQSLKFSEEAQILGNIVKQNMRFGEVTQINGNVVAQRINNIPVDQLKEMLQSQNPQIRADIVQDTIKNIEGLVQENVDVIKRLPDQYLYLEKSDNLSVNVPNTVDAQIVNTKSGVFIHMKLEEPGYVCGLPESCVCPNQQTAQISPEYSIYMLDNKYGHRVYTYQTDKISVHVVTNTKTSSDFCRLNGSSLHEYTTLSWSILPEDNSNNSSKSLYQEQITGYISDVEFFTFEGQVYIILSKYFDPVLNTHHLDCQVLRISKEKNALEDIQRIGTNGAWNLHVFYTAQGVNLIIGSKFYSDYETLTTDIYRFNPTTKTFLLLRNVPSSGCASATSVVLGYDSLIILAHIKSPLLILKHHPVFDNYYLYQSFVLEHPVLSVSAFYTGGVGISDAYLTAVADNGQFYVYSYQYLAGWKLKSEGQVDGLKGLLPFKLNKAAYLFAPSTENSSFFTIVKHGYN